MTANSPDVRLFDGCSDQIRMKVGWPAGQTVINSCRPTATRAASDVATHRSLGWPPAAAVRLEKLATICL
jgi:hypothetical protein